MWISRRTDYATRAVLALALADGGPLKLDSIAETTEAPRSVRGPAGGYRLNLAPAELTLERVVRVFQGQLAPIGYATRKNPDAAPEMVERSLKHTWEEVRDATIEILGRTTFADLAAATKGR